MKKFKPILIISVMLLVVAVGFLLYPTVSNIINDITNESRVSNYSNVVSALSDDEESSLLEEAENYNKLLYDTEERDFEESDDSDYYDILNVDNGIMCSVDIPKINVNLPVYHGIDDDVLDEGAGHIPGTSFPIGGENTHAVISAHTAYPGKTFFNDLTKLEVGDEFYINVLNKTLKYRVFEVNIVEPNDTSLLGIDEGEDYVSLLTCYPYAVNTHRLIVTGKRVTMSSDDEVVISSQSSNVIPRMIFVISIVVGVLIVIFVVWFIIRRKFKK
jgi:sortase A